MLKELVPGIWLETSYESGNVGVIESERGVLLVDPPMRQADAQALQVNLRALGLTTIYGIVNTDYHPDHFLGNAFFMPTRILGHELAAKSIAKYETTPDQVGNPYPTEDAVEDVAQVEVCSPRSLLATGSRSTSANAKSRCCIWKDIPPPHWESIYHESAFCSLATI